MTDTVLSPTRLQALRDVGTEIDHDDEWVENPTTGGRRRVALVNTVRSITLPFSAQEWCDVAMRDGDEYIGGCCGNMSEVQDIINEAFRDSGSIDAANLLTVGQLLAMHEDGIEPGPFETDDEFDAVMAKWKANRLSPWEKIIVIFRVLEPALKPSGSHIGRPHDATSTEDIMSVVRDTTSRLSWSWLFTPPDELTDQHRADQLVRRAKLLPAVRELLAELEQSNDDFAGYAVVKTGTEELLRNGHGFCLYATKAEAKRDIKYWRKTQPDIMSQIEIVTARVNVKDGLQLRYNATDTA